MSNRKILIISHNPINKTDNVGRTIGNIFSKFKTDELCQLYFKNQTIEAKNCENFFCIDDVSMCKSMINRFYKTGTVKNNNTIVEEKNSGIENNIVEYGKKKNGITYCLRDILWKLGKWNTKELNNWIKEQNITSVFLMAGDYIFPFRIAKKICKKYNLPLYIYYVDEYYEKNVGNQTLTAKIHKSIYRKSFKKLITMAKEYFCISEGMENYYYNQFNKKGNTLMNTTKIEQEARPENEKLIISFIGNLEYDRWKNLIDIAEVIENSDIKEKIEFNVYSGETDSKILEKMKNTKGLNFRGRITPEEVKNKIKESDILLHVENFEKINVDRVKYSVSTKIPDSLASGNILFAYGPENVESIDYIKRNNAGIVVNKKEDIIKNLDSVLKKDTDKCIIKNAKNLVETNHRDEKVYDLLNKVLV